MNFQTELLPVLGACFSKEKQIRKTAENTLNLAKLLPGFLPYLLKLSVELEDEQIDIAQQAAIQLKNAIQDHWNSQIIDVPLPQTVSKPEDVFVVSNEDKEFIRNNIIEAIMKKKTNKFIYKQLLQAFKFMTAEDFKEKCDPQIINQIVEILNSDDLRCVEMGVKLIRKLIKNYEYRSEQKRGPMEQLCAAFFPKIEEILEQALQAQSEESFHFIHTCIKIFFVITHVEIPRFLFEDNLERMNNWLKLHFMVISGIKSPELEISQDPQEYEDRQDQEIFKMKGTALRSVFTLFQFYGSKKNPRDTESYKKLQVLLMKEHLHSFLNQAYKTILQAREVFTPAKLLNYSVKMFINLWTNDESKPLIKKELDSMVYEPALVITYLTPKDMELWAQNQVEFIRRHQDFRQALFFARNSMIDFIVLAVKPIVVARKGQGLKQKVTYNSDMLEKYLKFCIGTLTQYNEHKGSNPDSSQDFRIREAVLLVIGHLSEQVKKVKEFHSNMGRFLREFVLDGLKSDVGLIRWRCAWMFERYRNIPWAKIENSGDLLDEIIQGLLELLVNDSNLATRVQAAASLQPYFQYERTMELVHLHFHKVLNSYIELMREIDNDSLVYSLEAFVRKSGEDIIPHALVLSEQMSKSFMKYARSDEEDDEDDFRSIQASDDWDTAVGCLDGLKQILTTCRGRPDIIAQIEPFILPVIGYGLTPIGMEITDEALDLLSLIMRYGEKINPKLWLMYPVLCEMAAGTPTQDETLRQINQKEGGWGFEFFPNMMLPFQNFISKDPDTFVSDEAKLDILLATCEKVMKVSTLKDNQEVEYIVVGQLFITLLECLKGRIDNKVPAILEIVVKQLGINHNESDRRVRSMFLQIVCMALYYNGPLVLSLLTQQEGLLEKVFQELHKFMSECKLKFELRRSLFGLTSVLISQELPPIIQKNYNELFKAAASLAIKASKIKKGKQKRQKKEEDQKRVKGEIRNEEELSGALQKMKQLENEMSEDEEDYEDEEEEDHKSESDDGVLQFIDDDDDDEEALDIDDYYKNRGGQHILYLSPLDGFNEVQEFHNAMQLIPEERKDAIELPADLQAQLKDALQNYKGTN